MRPNTTVNWFFLKPAKIDGNLEVSIGLQDIYTGKIESAITRGILTDCSEEGGCLVLPRLLVDGKHIFFTTLNSERYHLVIGFDLFEEQDQDIEVTARSIWMDSRRRKNRTEFKLGIRFLDKQKNLFSQLQEWHQSNGQSSHHENAAHH